MSKATDSLTEVMLVAHFAGPLNLTVLDLADWVSANPAFDVPPQQTPAASPPNFGLPMPVIFNAGMPLPRLILRSSTAPFVLQMQVDRLGYSWARKDAIGQTTPYPGFETILHKFQEELIRFHEWHQKRFGFPVLYSTLELSYNNAVLPEFPDGTRRRLSSVFKFVVPNEGRKLHTFQVQWAELFQSGAPLPQVAAYAGVGLAQQYPHLTLTQVIFFNFAGHAEFAMSSDLAPNLVAGVANPLHERILEMYDASIASA